MSHKFLPCLYNFTMPEDTEEGVPVTPPLWAILDHLIAVSYHLYVPSDKHLDPDIAQLQWVLGFISSQNMECDKYKNLICLKNSLHTAILSKMRSPHFIQQQSQEGYKEMDKNVPKQGDNEGEEETETLCIPIVLMDILSQQPKYLRLKAKKKDTDDQSGIMCPELSDGNDACFNNVPFQTIQDVGGSCGGGSCAINFRKDDVMTMDKQELSRYLQTLKANQTKILEQEQEHLNMLNSIINKMK